MSKMTTEKYLVRALLDDGAMSKSLFEEELQEQTDEFLRSKQEDGDNYFFAISEWSEQGSAEIKVQMVYLNTEQHIPLERTCDLLEEFYGHRPSEGTIMINWLRKDCEPIFRPRKKTAN